MSSKLRRSQWQAWRVYGLLIKQEGSSSNCSNKTSRTLIIIFCSQNNVDLNTFPSELIEVLYMRRIKAWGSSSHFQLDLKDLQFHLPLECKNGKKKMG